MRHCAGWRTLAHPATCLVIKDSCRHVSRSAPYFTTTKSQLHASTPTCHRVMDPPFLQFAWVTSTTGITDNDKRILFVVGCWLSTTGVSLLLNTLLAVVYFTGMFERYKIQVCHRHGSPLLPPCHWCRDR